MVARNAEATEQAIEVVETNLAYHRLSSASSRLQAGLARLES
jgi:hypothetical protein